MDTIGLNYYYSSENDKNSVESYLEMAFEKGRNDLNPNNIVDLRNYKLYQFRNLRLMFFENRLKIQGSIPKFYSGNNVHQITDNEIANAFVKIQLELPFLNLYDCLVTRLDYAVSFRISCDPNLLIAKFIGKSYSSLEVYRSNSNTASLTNDSHQINVYDKSDEENENVIRIEYKMLNAKKIRSNFSYDKITLSYVLEHLNDLPFIWYQEYGKLIKDYTPIFKNITSKSVFLHAMVYSYGYENALKLVESAFRTETISESKKTNLKRYIVNMSKEGKKITYPANPMLELDELVEMFMDKFRNK